MHYGAARMAAHWAGLNSDETKAYWARKLGRLDRRQLGYALSNLPDKPPTIEEFLAVARRCPPPTFRALPYKPAAEEVEHNRQRARELAEKFGSKARGGA